MIHPQKNEHDKNHGRCRDRTCDQWLIRPLIRIDQTHHTFFSEMCIDYFRILSLAVQYLKPYSYHWQWHLFHFHGLSRSNCVRSSIWFKQKDWTNIKLIQLESEWWLIYSFLLMERTSIFIHWKHYNIMIMNGMERKIWSWMGYLKIEATKD